MVLTYKDGYVWLDRMQVGRGTVSIPYVDMMGMDTVREHFPTHDRSFINNAFSIIS